MAHKAPATPEEAREQARLLLLKAQTALSRASYLLERLEFDHEMHWADTAMAIWRRINTLQDRVTKNMPSGRVRLVSGKETDGSHTD